MGALLYDSGYSPATGRRTRIERDAATGLPLIVLAQNLAPITDANKRQAAGFDPHDRASRRAGVVHVARIPGVIYQRLQRLGITRDEKALNAWLNQRDNRVFRVDDGRTL